MSALCFQHWCAFTFGSEVGKSGASELVQRLVAAVWLRGCVLEYLGCSAVREPGSADVLAEVVVSWCLSGTSVRDAVTAVNTCTHSKWAMRHLQRFRPTRSLVVAVNTRFTATTFHDVRPLAGANITVGFEGWGGRYAREWASSVGAARSVRSDQQCASAIGVE